MKPNLILRLSLSLVLVLLALSVPASAQVETNLVPNQGFEVSECRNTPTGTEPRVCGWWLPGTWGAIVRDTSNPHSGSASLYVTNCDENGCAPLGWGFAAWTNCMPLTEPGYREASFWYRVTAGETVSLAGNYFRTPDCTGVAPANWFEESVIPDSNWHQVSGTLHVPTGTQSAMFGVGGYSENCDPDYCPLDGNFDDIYIESAPSSTSDLFGVNP